MKILFLLLNLSLPCSAGVYDGVNWVLTQSTATRNISGGIGIAASSSTWQTYTTTINGANGYTSSKQITTSSSMTVSGPLVVNSSITASNLIQGKTFNFTDSTGTIHFWKDDRTGLDGILRMQSQSGPAVDDGVTILSVDAPYYKAEQEATISIVTTDEMVDFHNMTYAGLANEWGLRFINGSADPARWRPFRISTRNGYGGATDNILTITSPNSLIGIENIYPAYQLDVTGGGHFTSSMTVDGLGQFNSTVTISGPELNVSGGNTNLESDLGGTLYVSDAVYANELYADNFYGNGSNLTGLIKTLAGVRYSTDTVSTSLINLSTITTALSGKLSSTATVSPSLIDLSTVTSALSGKQATGNYITALTGNVTAAGPGSAVATIVSVPTSAVDLSTVTSALSGKLATNGDGSSLTGVIKNLSGVRYSTDTVTLPLMTGVTASTDVISGSRITSFFASTATLPSAQVAAGAMDKITSVTASSATITGNSGQYGLTVSSGVSLAGLIYTKSGNVGIGTESPTSLFTVGSSKFRVTSSGATGLAGVAPAATTALNMVTIGSPFNAGIDVQLSTSGIANAYGIASVLTGANTTNFALYGHAAGATNNWGLYIIRGYSYFYDKVGIGTESPQTKLHISSGTITIDGTASPAKGAALCLTAAGTLGTCTGGTFTACTCTP